MSSKGGARPLARVAHPLGNPARRLLPALLLRRQHPLHRAQTSRRLRANGAVFSTSAAIFTLSGPRSLSGPNRPSVPKISGVSDAPAFTCSARKRGEQRTRSHPRRRGRRRAAHAKGNRHRPTHPRFPRWEWGANKRVLKSGMKSCTPAKLARSQRGTKWKAPFHKGYQ